MQRSEFPWEGWWKSAAVFIVTKLEFQELNVYTTFRESPKARIWYALARLTSAALMLETSTRVGTPRTKKSSWLLTFLLIDLTSTDTFIVNDSNARDAKSCSNCVWAHKTKVSSKMSAQLLNHCGPPEINAAHHNLICQCISQLPVWCVNICSQPFPFLN